MKTSSIVVLVALALGVAIIVMSYGNSSTYRCFNDSTPGKDQEFHVVGTLPKGIQGSFNPAENPNLFVFSLTDSCGTTRPVKYEHPKPQDFDRSDKIVCVGKLQNDTFVASKILLKCPSKYNDAKLEN